MSVVYYFERKDIFPLRGKMNKAVTMETILASGHPSDRFWGRRRFGRKFLLASLCWVLAGIWHWPLLAPLYSQLLQR